MEIVVKELCKSFGTQRVLDGISLEIEAGKITVIIGGSGTGKSVFLKHLIGLIQPDSGAVFIDGQDIAGLSERELMPIRRRFGMIFQNGAMLASIPLLENVALGLVENGLAPRAEAEQRAEEKLELVGLKGQGPKMPSVLSGGMRKRAAIARALTLDPDCILYDEPTAGLDPPRSRQIEEVILDVNRQLGATSIVVTHDLDTVERIADRVFMLHEGRIIFEGEREALQASDHPVVQEFIQR